MKHFLSLIIPDKLELLLWSVVGLVLLIVLNTGRLLSWITKSAGTQDVDFIGGYLNQLDDLVDPRLIDFIVWVLAGIVVFLLFSVVVALFKTAGEEASILHYYRSPSGRYHEMVVFLSKSAVRLLGAICAVLWFNFYIKNVNPYLSDTFYDSVTTLVKDPLSWFWLVISVGFYMVYIYLLVIFCRIMFLRVRVFFSRQEEFDNHKIPA